VDSGVAHEDIKNVAPFLFIISLWIYQSFCVECRITGLANDTQKKDEEDVVERQGI